MRLIESFTMSKSGNDKLNEDGIYFNPPFAAVIDGTTSKDDSLLNGYTSGRFATSTILAALDLLRPEMPPFELISTINNALSEKIIEKGIIGKASASIVLFNESRNELILYGDNPYMIDGVMYHDVKEIDIITAKKRADVVRTQLLQGYTVEEIRKNDMGRKAILRDLRQQLQEYANKCVYGGYPVIAGQEIVPTFIKVHRVNKPTEIVLASDGYPKLFSTLQETEEYLLDCLKEDVLCIDKLLGTKCVAYGNVSYDDRSYLRILV